MTGYGSYYTLAPDGHPQLTIEGIAAITGQPAGHVADTWPTLPTGPGGNRTIPAEWKRTATRVRKELTALLGYEPGFQEALDLLEYVADSRSENEA